MGREELPHNKVVNQPVEGKMAMVSLNHKHNSRMGAMRYVHTWLTH